MTAQQPLFDLGEVAQIPAGSDWDQEFTLYEPGATSTAIDFSAVISASDVVRFRLWSTDGATSLITATSSVASAGGTTVTVNATGTPDTIPARITVDLSATDTAQTVGTYKFLVDVQDVSDSNRWQPACRGTIKITGAPA